MWSSGGVDLCLATRSSPARHAPALAEEASSRLAIYTGPLVQGYFSVITEIFDDSGRPHTLVSQRAVWSLSRAPVLIPLPLHLHRSTWSSWDRSNIHTRVFSTASPIAASRTEVSGDLGVQELSSPCSPLLLPQPTHGPIPPTRPTLWEPLVKRASSPSYVTKI